MTMKQEIIIETIYFNKKIIITHTQNAYVFSEALPLAYKLHNGIMSYINYYDNLYNNRENYSLNY